MSSKVSAPEDSQGAAPVVWRQVGGGATGRPAATAGGPPDPAARIAHVERQAEQKIKEAREAGLREGEAAGRKHGAAELQAATEQLARAIDDLGRLRPGLRKEAEADTVRLALAVARRVLRRELAVDPDAIRGVVVAALEKLEAHEVCRVRVHPSHAAALAACLRGASIASSVEVVPDPSSPPGTVVFETRRGNLDASIDTQLQEIERGLADRLQKHA